MRFRRLKQRFYEAFNIIVDIMENPTIRYILYTLILICMVLLISYLGFSFSQALPKEFISIGTAILTVLFSAASSFIIKQVFEKLFIQAKAKIYISHSAKDKSFVQQLARSLQNYRFEVILDEELILAGDNLQEKVCEIISKSDFFIFVISQSSSQSTFAREELRFAIQQDKKILPVLIEHTDIPNEVSAMRYADFTVNYEASLKFLIKSINAKQAQFR